ncbi:glycosyltransferase family 25 protein, partial [Aureobasidium melanogenum]
MCFLLCFWCPALRVPAVQRSSVSGQWYDGPSDNALVSPQPLSNTRLYLHLVSKNCFLEFRTRYSAQLLVICLHCPLQFQAAKLSNRALWQCDLCPFWHSRWRSRWVRLDDGRVLGLQTSSGKTGHGRSRGCARHSAKPNVHNGETDLWTTRVLIGTPISARKRRVRMCMYSGDGRVGSLTATRGTVVSFVHSERVNMSPQWPR